MHISSYYRGLTSVLYLLAFSGSSSAALITFTAEDLGAGPGSAIPNSAAASASFNAAAAALGPVSLINFEAAPLGTFSSLVVAPGVTISGTTYQGANQSIVNTPNFPANPALDGFNTTAGGSKYLEVFGGTLTFTFASPVQFFGAYLMGIQTVFFQDTVTFSDGSSQSINVPGAGTTNSNGALTFVGFTDAGKSIASITINASSAGGADAIGVDEVRYQSAAVPEPASLG